MNRPNLIRSIYAELREVAGDVANSAELLKVAAALVEAADPEARGGHRELNGRTGGVPFDRWALDVAMADGGWRILRYETELGTRIYGDEVESESAELAYKDWMMEHAA